MTIEELNAKLLEAYSEQNLNKITLTLLNLYKEQQFATLNKISALIEDFVQIEIADDGKGFSKLIMLYHPDRGDIHRNAIETLTFKGDFDGLLEFSHILKLMRIDEIADLLESYEDIDYSPVYAWDVSSQTDGYNVVSDEPPGKTHHERPKRQKFFSFYEAFKIRIFGHTQKEIPYYYFEDLDEIEMTESSIDNLDGIAFCKHAVVVDLSGNRISDLSELWELSEIEELNLSGNQIEMIDIISNLTKLRALDLSFNLLTDVSPLFDLPKLEQVNLTGNRIQLKQVEELRGLGVEITIDQPEQ
ncbi:MAG: leucine-rich repeat domain-containing protein [Prolixibacteraceae bacterium]|nr:leucine-rich repeat domain-containing protein [Prolixibacteraceae bacterium]